MTVPAWLVWTIVGLQWLGAFATIFLIGEQRPPRTKWDAAFAFIGCAAWTYLALYWGGYL